jgi:hypothetical protein
MLSSTLVLFSSGEWPLGIVRHAVSGGLARTHSIRSLTDEKEEAQSGLLFRCALPEP